jgi:hypothetical protein
MGEREKLCHHATNITEHPQSPLRCMRIEGHLPPHLTEFTLRGVRYELGWEATDD